MTPIPTLPPNVPRRGSPLTRFLGRLVLTLLRWRVTGNLPDLRKMVIIVEPHTSNLDFVVGMGAYFGLNLRASFLGKHTLFKGLFGRWLRYMGGIPVDRSRAEGVVQDSVAAFDKADQLVLAVAPSGTRRVDAPWKTGFHRIARGARVPVVPVSFDYGRRTLTFGAAVELTDDTEADIKRLQRFYEGVRGRHS